MVSTRKLTSADNSRVANSLRLSSRRYLLKLRGDEDDDPEEVGREKEEEDWAGKPNMEKRKQVRRRIHIRRN